MIHLSGSANELTFSQVTIEVLIWVINGDNVLDGVCGLVVNWVFQEGGLAR